MKAITCGFFSSILVAYFNSIMCAEYATFELMFSALGMCKRCGNVRMIACSTCRGTGLVKEGGVAGLNFIDDLYQSLGGDESKVKSIACTKCQAKGHFCCPDCSKT